MSDTAEHALTLRQVSKSYGGRRVVDSVDFDVPTGSITGLLGPNGAGKTTLFALIAGLVRPDEGRITALGQDISDLRPLYGRIGILPQDALYQANLPISEQLSFFLVLMGRSRSDAAIEVAHALHRVGLADYYDAQAATLSHGMHKRLGLAQAFLGAPELILLDEPTSGLDPANATTIRELIRDHRRAGATIIISSHDLAEMQALCDHVCILKKGRVVSAGPVDELLGSARRFRFELWLPRALAPTDLPLLAALPGTTLTAHDQPGRYLVAIDAADDDAHGDRAVAALLRTLLDLGLTPRSLSAGNRLESHFREVTERKG